MKTTAIITLATLACSLSVSQAWAQKEVPAQQPASTAAPQQSADVMILARAYKDYRILSREYKNTPRGFDHFENPTGLFVRQGETLHVQVDGKPATQLHLLIHSFEEKTVNAESLHPIAPGQNTITAPHEGLVYVQYFTEDGSGQPVQVRIQGGTENGIYTIGDGAARWQQLLNAPGSEYLDIVTRYTHLVYNKEGLRKHCPQDPEPLLHIYDDLMHDQLRVMGLLKYNRWQGNHLMGRNGIGGFMHADGLGAYFSKDSMGAVVNVNKLDHWAIAHEFGHVNQLSPGLRWHGCSEVTNNIFSMRARMKYEPNKSPLEDNTSAFIDGTMSGGCFNCFFQGALLNQEPFRFQMGPSNLDNYATGGDVFVSLVPFWQLELYFNYAGMGNRDFYPDICEKFRRDTDDAHLTPGQSQVRFCCYACDVTGQNLMPFFEAVGLLREVDREIGDYGEGRLTISPAMIREARAYGAKYPAPESPVMHLISSHSYEFFQKRVPVQGTTNVGVTLGQNFIHVDHAHWKNVVAFYTYAGDKLVRITLPGTGHTQNKATRCPLPAGATHVDAVGWDGKTSTVYRHANTDTSQAAQTNDRKK